MAYYVKMHSKFHINMQTTEQSLCFHVLCGLFKINAKNEHLAILKTLQF